jgi:hypothetical protein
MQMPMGRDKSGPYANVYGARLLPVPWIGRRVPTNLGATDAPL